MKKMSNFDLYMKEHADKLLQSEYAGDIIRYMMSQYADKSLANAQELLQFSNTLVSGILEKTCNRIQELNQATSMLVFQRWVEKNAPKDRDVLFSIMLPVCKAMFPGGYVKKESWADHEYFERFLELMNDKKVFDKTKDARWLETWGYTEYIEKVEAAEKGSDEDDS